MTSAIVLPPLKNWAQGHLTALITASTDDNFKAAFNSFIANDVKINFNGVDISRDDYLKKLEGERALERSASVKFDNSLDTPIQGTQNNNFTGVVGLFFEATYVEKVLIFGAPAEHIQTSTLIVKVEQVGPVPVQPPHVVGGGTDRRRVVELTQVSVDKQNTITPPK